MSTQKKKTMKILFYSQDEKQIIFLYTVQGAPMCLVYLET